MLWKLLNKPRYDVGRRSIRLERWLLTGDFVIADEVRVIAFCNFRPTAEVDVFYCLNA